MINKLTVKNFQSHKFSELEFDNGVNVIVGLSDSGKTALLRAFEWVRKNQPLGFGFLKTGEKRCQVSVELENREVIIRQRDGKENKYLIVYNDNTYNSFEAMRGDVPEEIENMINLSDINIQTQLEPHFLVLGSSGNIAKTIDEVIRLDEANNLISKINQEIRKVDSEISGVEKAINDNEERLSEFDYLNEFENLLEGYKLQEAVVSDIRNKVTDLENLLKEYVDLEEQLSELVILTGQEIKFINNVEKTKLLSDKISEYFNCEEKIKNIPVLEQEEEFYIDKMFDFQTLSDMLEDWHIQEEKLVSQITKMKSCDSLKRRLLEKINTCPLCKSILTDQTRKNLIDSMENSL